MVGAHGVGFSQPIKDIANGFFPITAHELRSIHGDLDGLITSLQYERYLTGMNGRFAVMLDNKEAFGKLVSTAGIETPENFCVFRAGRILWNENGQERLRQTLEKTGRFIIKPTNGKQGKGVKICRDLADLKKHDGFDAVVTSFVFQADYAKAIYEPSLNTIRVLMLRDRDNRPVPLRAFHRFGTLKSGSIDNLSAKGISASVDIESGALGKAAVRNEQGRMDLLDQHPDTGSQISGVQIPDWDLALKMVEDLGNAFPFLTFVGWDLAMTPEGPTVIEGNSHPTIWAMQYYDRYIADDQIRGLFSQYIPNLEPTRL